MTQPPSVAEFLLSLPALPFAQIRAKDGHISLFYEGRQLAVCPLPDCTRPLGWSATQCVNTLAHQAIFTSGISGLSAGESLNAVHQIIEWWDGMIFAIAARSQE